MCCVLAKCFKLNFSSVPICANIPLRLVFRAAGAAALKRMLYMTVVLPAQSLFFLSLSQRPSFVAVVVLNGSDHLV